MTTLSQIAQAVQEAGAPLKGLRMGSQGGVHFDASPQIPETLFRYQGHTFTILAFRKDRLWHLHLYAFLGQVPYSAESPDHRQSLLDLFEKINLSQERMFRLEETINRNILYCAERLIEPPLSSLAYLTEIVSLLLDLKPYLGFIKENSDPLCLQEDAPKDPCLQEDAL